METLVSYSDGENETTFIASFIPAESWNGAAMPFFTFSEASRIAEDCETSRASSTFYRWHNGSFQEDINADTFEPKWADVETMIDPATGATLYRMGDGWTWFELTADYYPVDDIRAAVAELQRQHNEIPASELHFPGASELTK